MRKGAATTTIRDTYTTRTTITMYLRTFRVQYNNTEVHTCIPMSEVDRLTEERNELRKKAAEDAEQMKIMQAKIKQLQDQ